MNGEINEWMTEVNEWMNEWLKWMNEWMNEGTSGWVDGWIIEWMNQKTLLFRWKVHFPGTFKPTSGEKKPK